MTISATDIVVPAYSKTPLLFLLTQKVAQKFGYVLGIGEDSFIGAGCIILPGSKIGKFCIVGAGAVVKGNFEDYSVIVGSPARKIKDIRDE